MQHQFWSASFFFRLKTLSTITGIGRPVIVSVTNDSTYACRVELLLDGSLSIYYRNGSASATIGTTKLVADKTYGCVVSVTSDTADGEKVFRFSIFDCTSKTDYSDYTQLYSYKISFDDLFNDSQSPIKYLEIGGRVSLDGGSEPNYGLNAIFQSICVYSCIAATTTDAMKAVLGIRPMAYINLTNDATSHPYKYTLQPKISVRGQISQYFYTNDLVNTLSDLRAKDTYWYFTHTSSISKLYWPTFFSPSTNEGEINLSLASSSSSAIHYEDNLSSSTTGELFPSFSFEEKTLAPTITVPKMNIGGSTVTNIQCDGKDVYKITSNDTTLFVKEGTLQFIPTSEQPTIARVKEYDGTALPTPYLSIYGGSITNQLFTTRIGETWQIIDNNGYNDITISKPNCVVYSSSEITQS